MAKSDAKKSGVRKSHPGVKDRGGEVANIFEWLITAFILAFVFRAFVMEAFRIPTGSMADTLMGAHYRLRCPQCGYEYNYGWGNFDNRRMIRGYVKPQKSRCPSCGYYQLTGGTMPIVNGDRILVLKCVYQFLEPKQWDVVVFKNPLNPAVNYIKRLVGRPGETVEIIDGDIYINGLISRKPPKVQDELWMPVYDNDYQPVEPRLAAFNGHPWQQPFKNEAESKWELDETNPTVFHLNSSADQISMLIYDTSTGNDFRATYAYGSVKRYNYMPYCSDLMVRFCADCSQLQGCIGIELSKYESRYKAWIDFEGKMVIAKVSGGEETVLNRSPIEQTIVNKPTLIKFANVDHKLVFQVGSEKLMYDMGRLPDDAGERETEIEPEVKIFGSGELTLSHVAIFRDIHYTGAEHPNSGRDGRAIEGSPFKLEKDEFFVLGDNSPNSEDCRWWDERGKANKGMPPYREGIVPRDYLVGKAMFVYWPGGFEFPWPRSVKESLLKNGQRSRLSRAMYHFVSWKWVPNIGMFRFIDNGSNKNR